MTLSRPRRHRGHGRGRDRGRGPTRVVETPSSSTTLQPGRRPHPGRPGRGSTPVPAAAPREAVRSLDPGQVGVFERGAGAGCDVREHAGHELATRDPATAVECLDQPVCVVRRDCTASASTAMAAKSLDERPPHRGPLPRSEDAVGSGSTDLASRPVRRCDERRPARQCRSDRRRRGWGRVVVSSTSRSVLARRADEHRARRIGEQHRSPGPLCQVSGPVVVHETPG